MSGHLEQPQPGCCSPETKATSSAPSLPICPLWTSKESSLLLLQLRDWNVSCKAKQSLTFFFKEPLVFPLLAEARALCLATNRLPTSRCAQSIHPHSSKRKGLGREQAAWSPPTLFTQINEESLNRNVFSSSAVEAMLWPVTHPLPARLEENPGFMIKDCFHLCASPCGTTQLEQCFKLF